jgi:hypothetical protein
VTHVSYTLRPVFWFIWRWDADYDWGQRSETGLSFGRATARWSARARVREAKAGGRQGRKDIPPSRPHNPAGRSPSI